ncbi:MAG: hypothetical protein C4554_03105 [Dethiobacter sp.]|nr:MAG: hypothetical protein C4554_03105 [Dethiobacter sp.]
MLPGRPEPGTACLLPNVKKPFLFLIEHLLFKKIKAGGVKKMERKKRLDEIHGQIMELKDRFKHLGYRLIQEGERLKNPGCPPDDVLFQEVAEETKKFKLLTEKLAAAGRALSWSGLNGGVDSLDKMEEMWKGLAGHLTYLYVLEQQTEQAIALVKRAMQATLPGKQLSAELESFKKKLRYYEEVLSRNVDDEEAAEMRRQFLTGVHPLIAFLRLAEEYLGDHEEASELFLVSAREFGNLLTVAAARGNLILPQSDQKGAERNEEEVKIKYEAKKVKEVEKKESGSKSYSGYLDEMNVEPVAGRKLNQRERLVEQIFNLIRDGKLGPAFWLNCYCEQVWEKAPLPSWLIKAVEIAEVVEGDGGVAAGWLSYIYKHNNFESLLEKKTGGENKLVFSLFSAASLLRPALVAPGSGAPLLLKKIGGLPGGIQELCAVLAGNGEQVGLDWKKELQALSHEVTTWQKRNQKLTLASPLAVKLWEKMQEEGELLYKLLQPVKENAKGALEDIRMLVSYLREENNLKKEVADLYYGMQDSKESLEIFHIPGSWQVLARLREALKLAERWLKLHERITKNKEARTPQKDDLREPLLSARKDLEGAARKYGDDTMVSAGIALCERVFDSLEKYFQERRTEIPTAEVLSALELSKNPQLKLKPSWKPKAETVEKLGKALVELLNEGEVNTGKAETKNDDLEFAVRKEAGTYNLSNNDTALPTPNLRKTWERDEVLSPQERDFLMNTLRSFYKERTEQQQDLNES